MSTKIRRVDFSPDEYIAGVNGLRVEEQGVYWMVCSLIYSRGEPVDNDERWIAHAAGCTPPFCRKLIDGLIARGKLALDEHGRLTNTRVERELGRAAKRVHDASTASARGVDARRTRAGRKHVSGKIKDLAEPAGSKHSEPNHQLFHESESESESESKKDSDALPSGRAPARARKTPSKLVNGGAAHDAERHRLPEGWRPTPDQREFAQAQGLDPDATAEAFVLYWVEGKGRTQQRSDGGWNLTWRGWCRRDAERGGRGTAPKDRPPDRPPRGGGLAGAAARVLAGYRKP